MKKETSAFLLALLLLLLCGCGSGGRQEGRASAQAQTEQALTEQTTYKPPASDAQSAAPTVDPGLPDTASAADSFGSDGEVCDDYPYDIAADRASFDDSNVDIVVGDHLYMTQINDWFTNFDDYDGKSVEIEGYYIKLGDYNFVGRLGPSCPYCSGGYVDFEFSTDEDLSAWIPGSTWIAVTGILRQGTTSQDGQDPQPFYYIEAMKLEEMDAVGIDTITN